MALNFLVTGVKMLAKKMAKDKLKKKAKDFVKGKDVELDADADSQSYTAGTLTFANWDIQFAVGAEGSISDVFVDKSSIGSTFTTDAASFAEIVTAKKDDAGATNSEYTWTRWYAVNN